MTKKNEHHAGEKTASASKNAAAENDGGSNIHITSDEALPDAETAEAGTIAKLEADLAESKDKYLRLMSEFENYKKRNARERIELVKMAGADILLSVLPVVDDFERAIKSISETQDAKTARDGVMLIYSKMKNILESKGIKAMEAEGKIFDPDLHDAISSVPAPSEDMKGKVTEEIEKGYFLGDKVIRHAKVIVGS